jgi:hypothetical protein
VLQQQCSCVIENAARIRDRHGFRNRKAQAAPNRIGDQREFERGLLQIRAA